MVCPVSAGSEVGGGRGGVSEGGRWGQVKLLAEVGRLNPVQTISQREGQSWTYICTREKTCVYSCAPHK